MKPKTVVLLFDIVILILGLNVFASAWRMKKTGIPSAILIPKEEQGRMKNTKGFCQKMYQPTILFGAAICLYGAVDILNQMLLKIPVVEILSMACFLIVCFWYVRKLREVKEEYMRIR